VIAGERERLARGDEPRPIDVLVDATMAWLAGSGLASEPPARTVNATGVILHTNLGRALWPEDSIEAAAVASEYLYLEMDRATGRRGRRYRLVEELLSTLVGSEDSIVTNNNAAAVVLACHLAGRRGIAVARGELVEIGGGVRIPDIVRRSGARLIEVGTTNKTRLEDFDEVLADGRAVAVLRVHASNFEMTGFVESPKPSELASLAHRHNAIVIDDLGSGALLDTSAFGLPHEPTPQERLAAGADIVTFSGDKLVGGPQAGLIVGREALIGRIRRDPLARAMRPDKVILAAIHATLGIYLEGCALRDIPVWRMISRSSELLRGRADLIQRRLQSLGVSCEVVPTTAVVGGGSLPGATLPSWGIALHDSRPERLSARLRTGDPSVVARVEDGVVVLDLRATDDRWDPDSVLPGAISRAVRGD
jgi:L-seryl-tRNA(Ser) seleniumtransferase